MSNIELLGGPGWFRLGDQDLATHIERTRRIRAGEALSQVVHDFCRSWGIGPVVLPMSDQPVRTIVQSSEGDLAFQEYFVHRHCEPHVTGFKFLGLEAAKLAPGVAEAIGQADAIVICPSNPWVSIGPILAILSRSPGSTGGSWAPGKQVVAVSPIIGGRAVKGPAAKMYGELGIQPSAFAVAEHYRGLATDFILDHMDAQHQDAVRRLNMRTLVTQTLMQTRADRHQLAKDVLDFIGNCHQ